MYEELLTQAEIQGNINKVNSRYHAKVIVLIGVLFLTFCNANRSGRQFPCFSGVFFGSVWGLFVSLLVLLIISK